MTKRILFVDDERNILEGLRRMLRSQRKEWDMAFAEGGAEALELMENQPFDAIISDMRMPGMDGAELLENVKNRWPETVRFILSGHSDQELVMRSVGPSHQYLAKPCDAETLKSKLASTFALRNVLASDSHRRLVTSMTTLPSLPVIYKAVVEELQSEDASINKVGDLICQDPGMAMKVLQLVNSAYFGLRRHISSPVEAASFLGLDILKSLVMSEGVFSQFDEDAVMDMDLDTVRSQGLQIASIARQIAKAEGADDLVADQSFLSGMLLDMGSLVMAGNMPEEFRRSRTLAEQENISIWEAEQAVFGTSHAEIGAYLLGLWGIDDDVVAAVAYHHRPGNFPDTQFSPVTAVYIANSLVNVGPGGGVKQLTGELDIDYLQSLGLDTHIEDWAALCAQPAEDVA